MRTFNTQITTNQLLNANFTSNYVALKNIYTYSAAAIITGTPTGTIKLQASNDPDTNEQVPGSQPVPTNWVDVDSSIFTVTAPGETMWNVNAVGYNFVRVVYTDNSSGSSTARLKIIFNGKGV